MKPFKEILLFVFLMMGVQLVAQDTNAWEQQNIDTNYLQYNVRRWSIRVYPDYKYHGFGIKSSSPKAKVAYRPNGYFGLGFGFNYKQFALDYTAQFQLDGTFVETKRTDIQTLFQLQQRYLVSLSFQSYKGMIDQSMGFKWYNVYRSDVKSQQAGMMILYNTKPKEFFLIDGFNGKVEQRKQIISFLPGVYASWVHLSGDSSLVSNEGDDVFNEYGQMEKTNLGALGGTVAGAYVKPLKHRMYVLLMAAPGLGFTMGKVETETLTYSPSLFPNFRLMGRGSVGWIQDWFYMNLVASFRYFFLPLKETNHINYTNGEVKLVLGIRLKYNSVNVGKISL